MPHTLKTVPSQKRAARKRAAVSEVLPSQPLTLCFSAEGALLLGSLVQINGRLRRQESHARRTDQALDQHPFVARLLQHIDLNADDLKTFEALIVDEVTVSRRRDLIVDGYEYRKLQFHQGRLCRALQAVAQRQASDSQRAPARRHRWNTGQLPRARRLFRDRNHRCYDECLLARFLRAALLSPTTIRLALTWIAVQEAAIYAEHIIDVGRRTPVERLSHFLLEASRAPARILAAPTKPVSALSFSQEVMADVLGMSVPHLNRMMQETAFRKADRRKRTSG